MSLKPCCTAATAAVGHMAEGPGLALAVLAKCCKVRLRRGRSLELVQLNYRDELTTTMGLPASWYPLVSLRAVAAASSDGSPTNAWPFIRPTCINRTSNLQKEGGREGSMYKLSGSVITCFSLCHWSSQCTGHTHVSSPAGQRGIRGGEGGDSGGTELW